MSGPPQQPEESPAEPAAAEKIDVPTLAPAVSELSHVGVGRGMDCSWPHFFILACCRATAICSPQGRDHVCRIAVCRCQARVPGVRAQGWGTADWASPNPRRGRPQGRQIVGDGPSKRTSETWDGLQASNAPRPPHTLHSGGLCRLCRRAVTLPAPFCAPSVAPKTTTPRLGCFCFRTATATQL